MNLGVQVSYLKCKTCRHFKKIEVVAETLNPKKYKIAQREALMGNPSGVNRIWKPGMKSIVCENKRRRGFAVDKAIESGLINLDKRWCIKRFRISIIRN
jgi:hypothetical protein